MFNTKKIIKIGVSAMLVGSVLPSFQIHAIEKNDVTAAENVSSGISEEYLESIGIDINSDEYYITDYQMELIAKKLGYDISLTDSSVNATARSAGVTKIVKVGKGSWDIYFSKSFIINYYYAGALSASVLAALIPGLGAGAAGALATFAAGVAGETQSGGYFQVRNWKVVYAGEQ